MAIGFILGAARGSVSVVVAACVAAVLAGVCLGKIRVLTAGPGSLILPHGVVDVAGWVERIDQRSGARGFRLSIAPTLIGAGVPKREFPKRITLIWRGKLNGGVQPGDHVRVRVKFLMPPGPVWPGGYDPSFARWFRGIGANGIALHAPEKASAAAARPWHVVWTATVEGVRLSVANRIRAALPDTAGAVAVALVTGDRSGIPNDVRDDLRAAGLAHLLAISGLHMALFAGGVFWLIRAGLAVNADFALRRPIKKWAAAVALLAAGGYLLLSGAGLATQRAFIMITIMFVAVIADRPALSMRNVALAALIILVLTPESLLSVSFQLSFLAVIALVALYEFLGEVGIAHTKPFLATGWTKRIANFLAGYFWTVGLTTLVAGLATAPVAAYHFNRVAAFSLLGNLLAVPVVGTFVMPAAVVGLIAMPFGLERWPLFVMGEGISLVVWVAKAVAELPGAVRMLSQMPVSSGLLLTLGLLWLCLWRRSWRLFGLAVMLAGAGSYPLAQSLPTMMVAERAQQTAVRGNDGALVFSSSRAGKYASERWLLKFGDPASFEQAVKRKGFSCDAYGCTISPTTGWEISVVRHPSILDEECARARIVITTFKIRGVCPSAHKLITPRELDEKGVHVLVLSDENAARPDAPSALRVQVRTARAYPGDRPWTATPKRYRKPGKNLRRAPRPRMPPPKKRDRTTPPAPPLQVRI